MVIDKVSNLIISLKNAYNAKHSVVEFPYTKFSESILEVLRKEGFILDFDKKGKKPKETLEISLKYENGVSALTDVQRVSKQSQRIYLGYKDIKPVKNGYGVSIISTPDGIMSSKEAKKKKLGGEELFRIW